MSKTHRIILLSAVALVGWPVTASANAGTPLVWATMFHLVIGNILIGIGEGWALARLFKLPFAKSALVMVSANYLSAWAGGLGLSVLASQMLPRIFGSQPLHRAVLVLGLVGVSSYLVSIILELPFCWFCLRESERPWRQAFVGSVAVQTLSYAGLVPFYLWVSPLTLLTSTAHDPTLRFVGKEKAWIYFIEAERGDVYRVRPDGTGREFLQTAGITNELHRLLLLPARDEQLWDLALVTERSYPPAGAPPKLLREHLAKRVRAPQLTDHIETTWFNFQESFDYRSEQERKWEIRLGFWAASGVRAEPRTSGETRHFALEAPFLMMWQARNATILPSGLLIYQLGPQIVALDVERKIVGVVTLGRGPAVVLEE